MHRCVPLRLGRSTITSSSVIRWGINFPGKVWQVAASQREGAMPSTVSFRDETLSTTRESPPSYGIDSYGLGGFAVVADWGPWGTAIYRHAWQRLGVSSRPLGTGRTNHHWRVESTKFLEGVQFIYGFVPWTCCHSQLRLYDVQLVTDILSSNHGVIET